MIYRHAGFTVIELMMVVALIAILSVIAAPSLRDLIERAGVQLIGYRRLRELQRAE